jgi:hypothetical protein
MPNWRPLLSGSTDTRGDCVPSCASCSVLDLERYDVPDDLGPRSKLEPADELLLLVRTDAAVRIACCSHPVCFFCRVIIGHIDASDALCRMTQVNGCPPQSVTALPSHAIHNVFLTGRKANRTVCLC